MVTHEHKNSLVLNLFEYRFLMILEKDFLQYPDLEIVCPQRAMKYFYYL